MVFLLTFCTGEPNSVVRIRVSVGDLADIDSYQHADVTTARWRTVRTADEPALPWTHLLPFELVEAHFETMVIRWLDLAQQQRIPLLEYFSVLLDERMFLDESFVRVVRAIEAWHRTRFGGQLLPTDQYKDMLKKLKKMLPVDEWNLAKMRLQHGNQLTLKERLDDLICRAGEPLQAIMQGGYSGFTRRVTLTRNHVAHGGINDPDVFSDEEMIWARRTLEMVFTVSILDALGFADESPKLVRRTQLFRILTDSFNTLASSSE
jgi:hypothetical protein